MEAKLTPDLERDFDRNKDQIKKLLTSEIMKRYYFQKGELINSLKEDDVLDKADMIRADLKEKGNKLKDISGIPIIGSIVDTKADEILDQADQISDLRQETQQYQDDLISSRNRLMGNR